jgi:GT2 family glycosyltransferase
MDSRVSIIIPCREINDYTRECLAHCRNLEYGELEIIVLPDAEPNEDLDGVRIIPTGAVGPAEKRDLASELASGEILAFIDNDAYPAPSWLREAIKHFQRDEVGAVAGPAVTPDTDGLLQKAGGAVYASFMGSGVHNFRYVPKHAREVDDYPSCNILIRKSIFEAIGGFDTTFWPGEDTKLCLEITRKLGKKIVYDPNVLVYHHRRRLFKPHLQQVWNYAVHRGFFAREFPQTSRRPSYFLPSVLSLGILLGLPLALLSPLLRTIYLSALGLYLILVLAASLPARDTRLIPLVFLGIIAMHLTYGLGFIKGLLTKRLTR